MISSSTSSLLGSLSGRAATQPRPHGVVGAWVGAMFLGMIGLAFWIVYLTNHDHWWAIIPGGVMLTLAAVSAVAPFAGGFATGGLFFLGMGLTFALVGVIPTPQGRMTWAFIPAAVMGIMGLLVIAAVILARFRTMPGSLINRSMSSSVKAATRSG